MKAVDVDLARLACARGWISRDCLEQSLAEADRYLALGLEKSVEEIFIEQGNLTGGGAGTDATHARHGPQPWSREAL